ncbi:MAG: hypothetical protein LAT57_13915, partial [Balneolales bacterium]|nr:hypothetical protein [Balneolales bacterium]
SLLEPLPENTTVIFQLSTDLRDTRNNPLGSPISLAVSTGSVIDKGEISLKVRPLRPGISTENVSVLLYRDSLSLSDPARYVGFPDTSGTVNFRYLSAGTYSAIVLEDINRNRKWDPQREYAQPYNVADFTLTDDEPLDLGTIWYARRDTLAARLEAVGQLSSQRLRLRFSRDIVYAPQITINIINDSTDSVSEAALLYTEKNDSNIAFFHIDEPMEDESTYRIDLNGLTDMNGNLVRTLSSSFEGSSESDTTFVRFKRHHTEQGIRTDEPIILVYNGVLDGTGIADSLQIYKNRSIDRSTVDVSTWYNLLQIQPITRWSESDSYEIKTWNPETQRMVDITTRFIGETDLGDLSITIADSSKIGSLMVLELFDNQRKKVRSLNFTNEITVQNIVAGNYHLVVFEDVNEDGNWFSGSISPFRSPAAVFVNPRLPVRSRMTSELEISFEPD